MVDVCSDVLKWTSSKHRTLIKGKIYKVILCYYLDTRERFS